MYKTNKQSPKLVPRKPFTRTLPEAVGIGRDCGTMEIKWPFPRGSSLSAQVALEGEEPSVFESFSWMPDLSWVGVDASGSPRA